MTPFNEWVDSGGRNFLMVRQWPVVSLSVVQFLGIVVPQAPANTNPPGPGWMLEPPPEGGGQQRLMLYGYLFPRGRSVVNLQYSAGYLTADTVKIVAGQSPPAPDPYTTLYTWVEDGGVAYVGGAALQYVPGTPSTGEYTINGSNQYVFASGDDGNSVVVTYSYVPPDLEQAVIELVGERFRQRDRIGLNSKQLPEGGSVSFLVKDMSEAVRTSIQPYRRVTPS